MKRIKKYKFQTFTGDQKLIFGVVLGLLGGLMGNILVTSMYRMIDGVQAGYNCSTFVVGLFLFLVIVWKILRFIFPKRG